MKGSVFAVAILFFLIASCGAAENDGQRVEIHGFVVGSTESVVRLEGDQWQYKGTGAGQLTTSGTNIPHIAVTYSSHPQWAKPGRTMLLKVEDQKGASLAEGDFVRLMCVLDLSESVGGHVMNSLENGYEVQGCRLITPYVDRVGQ